MNDFPDRPGGADYDAERLRRLLDDAVSDIEPRDALGSIHARTKVTSMSSSRSWFLGAAAAVVATAATVAAVTVLSGDGTSDDPGFAGPSPSAGTSPSEATSPSTSSEPSPSETAGPTEAVPVYYVADTPHGVRLYREFHDLQTGGDPLTAAPTCGSGRRG
jgi:hypothetical protein